MKYLAIIPARYASTRFPGKPLALLGGKPVIQHVYEQVHKLISDVYVATDDSRIYEKVLDFGGQAIMTSPDHKCGTDRVHEAFCNINNNHDVVVNVQGDEPFIQVSQLHELLECFKDDQTQIATLGKPFETIEALENPNSPKIVLDNNSFAMYFSRSVIPYIRGKEKSEWLGSHTFLKHIGVYAYRSKVLAQIIDLPQSSLEKAESLEQLRWLQNGYKIKVGLTNIETIGIDTPADLENAELFLKNRGNA